MIEIIAVAVFVSLSLVTVGAVTLLGSGRATTSDRLKAGGGGQGAGEADSGTLGIAGELVEQLGFWAQGTFAKDKNEKEKENLEMTLSHAGFRGPRAVPIYFGSRILSALTIAFGLTLFAYSREAEGGVIFSSVAFGSLLGFYLPRYFLKRKTTKRQIKIRQSLADCLDTIITCIEAGLGLNAALERVGNERSKVRGEIMGVELKYMTYELQAGVARDEAFHNLGERNGVDDLQALAAFMVQSEKLGSGLTEALKIYADELRTRRRQRAQEQANKAAVKLLFPLVFFIFPTMFLVILGPAIMKLQTSMSGVLK
jgi:tight adherence protein C